MKGLALFLLFSCLCLQCSRAVDSITFAHPIQDPQTIVSSAQKYRLGFFTPPNTTNRYVGIIMNVVVEQQTVIWVANRDSPLTESGGVVTISEDGNIVVLSENKVVLWSSNVANQTMNSTAQLLDSGNLVLKDHANGVTIWESFLTPTDHFVPKMRIGSSDSDSIQRLVSWKSPSDPSNGSFSIGFDSVRTTQAIVWNGSVPYWRSGPWDGNRFTGVPGMSTSVNGGFHMPKDDSGSSYLVYDDVSPDDITYNYLTSSGQFLQFFSQGGGGLREIWRSVSSDCDLYGKCGPFGICDRSGSRICNCLHGFEQTDEVEWRSGNWTGGCRRKALLQQCDRNDSSVSSRNGSSSVSSRNGKPDGFLKLINVKLPDFYSVVPFRDFNTEEECEAMCLDNCTCIAYAYNKGIGCMQWSSGLVDMQQFSFDGSEFFLRLSYSELDRGKSNRVKVAVITSIVVSLFIIGLACLSWWWFTRRRGAKVNKMQMMLGDKEELHLYSYETMALATDSFHYRNILGKGGFGPVYMGKLINGQEVAVKTLSNSSTQGAEEFMNEVLVICKLQHRNLVRLLGCCIEKEEKMLVYEYMPNKSLDAYLFDSSEQDFLDWNRRHMIIDGICRGLIYLHRDSRLRIIHRDLKASNILLDEEFNPKISDFGLARIFGGNQDIDKTNRVVGTFGYMAPEYAMRGKISEKSDVYSFGVLLLEIISGRRNSSFFGAENDLSLIGYAWLLWNDNETAKFTNPFILSEDNEMDISRYIHVGLLCVQEYAKDRPNMSAVLSMLNSEIMELPDPKVPGYATRTLCSSETENSHSVQSHDVTVTTLLGR